MRTLAIGDIHGVSTALDALLVAVKVKPSDRLVFLGDYVDRGPDTKGVLDRLLHLTKTHRVVCLRGNHELMMARSRDDKSERRMWMSVGGAQALASYGKAPGLSGTVVDVPTEHWDFLTKTCVDYYETESHIFVHANLDGSKPLDNQSEEKLFWEFLSVSVTHPSGKTVVCGHTSQKAGEPLDLGDTICIDTHAYGGGWLTCLDCDTYEYWQADVMGRMRVGQLDARGHSGY